MDPDPKQCAGAAPLAAGHQPSANPPQGKIFFVISKWEAYGERQPTTQALADAMPEDALIYEDETVKIYGFVSDEAMRQACGFAAFP